MRSAFETYINDVLLERIQGVANMSTAPTPLSREETKSSTASLREEENAIVTTQEELEGYLLVKAILREVINPARVTIRDRQTYCGILLDDNGRKPICRLHFNSATVKYIGTFDAEKNETKNKIDGLNDIYRYAELLKQTVQGYLDSAN